VCACGERKFTPPHAPTTRCLACETFQQLRESSHVDYESFGNMILRAGRNHGPALLCEAEIAGKITDDTIAGHVGAIWSGVEFPELALDWDDWARLFDIAGYRVDGITSRRPGVSIRLFRAAVPAYALGHSWTEDFDVAHGFLSVGGRDTFDAVIWAADVEPWRLLARITQDRPGESQYVVDTEGLEVSAQYHRG
jgi:hypothetical protein